MRERRQYSKKLESHIEPVYMEIPACPPGRAGADQWNLELEQLADCRSTISNAVSTKSDACRAFDDRRNHATYRERDALVPILRRIAAPRDGVLVVHSAMARLSRQGFRAETMIEVFLDYMSSGTVVMPTMSWRNVTPQKPEWDERVTPSETGVMTEIFRTRYALRRSIHPTHSVAACGVAADELVAHHPSTTRRYRQIAPTASCDRTKPTS